MGYCGQYGIIGYYGPWGMGRKHDKNVGKILPELW